MARGGRARLRDALLGVDIRFERVFQQLVVQITCRHVPKVWSSNKRAARRPEETRELAVELLFARTRMLITTPLSEELSLFRSSACAICFSFFGDVFVSTLTTVDRLR